MKIKSLIVLALAAFVLCACGGSGSDGSPDNSVVNTVPPVIPPVPPTDPQGTVSSSTWLRVPMHYQILLGQSHVWNEVGGIQTLTLFENAPEGSSSLKVISSAALVPQQLITYRGDNGDFYSAQVQSINNNILILATPLVQNVSVGINAWNFYDDGAHPNWAGSQAIADYSIRYLGFNRLNQGVHVLLGDSWFSRDSIYERLKQRLPAASISNKGIGGHTASDLLSRFNNDVSPLNPNFVWIMTSTNDYWRNVSAEAYKQNMKQ